MNKTKGKTIGVCSYHICKKRETVYKCKYCKKYFCITHSRAKPAGIPDFKSTRTEDKSFLEEYRESGGHPCISYVHHWIKNKENEEKEYLRELNRLLSSKSSRKLEEDNTYDNITYIDIKLPWYKRRWILIGIFVIVLLIVYYLLRSYIL